VSLLSTKNSVLIWRHMNLRSMEVGIGLQGKQKRLKHLLARGDRKKLNASPMEGPAEQGAASSGTAFAVELRYDLEGGERIKNYDPSRRKVLYVGVRRYLSKGTLLRSTKSKSKTTRGREREYFRGMGGREIISSVERQWE